jgi:hypothetical protein
MSGEYVEYVAERLSYFSSAEAMADLNMILRLKQVLRGLK